MDSGSLAFTEVSQWRKDKNGIKGYSLRTRSRLPPDTRTMMSPSLQTARLALEFLAREDTTRLAILDWMMAGVEGVQVCRVIRTERPYVYVLLLTARSE